MPEINLPTTPTLDIFSYGFDRVLNRKVKAEDLKNPLVYDVLRDIVKTELLPSGSLGGLFNLGKTEDIPSSKVSVKMATDFAASGRFSTAVGGSGATTFGGNGVQLATGATATSYARANWYYGVGRTMKGTAIFSCSINMASLSAATGAASSYFGLGLVDDSGSALNFTANPHCGFKILKSGGTVSLLATQAGSAGEASSDVLTTLVDSDDLELIVKLNPNDIQYFWRKNQEALSSATTLSINKPDPNAVRNETRFIVSNNDSAVAFSINVTQASIER